MINKFPVIASLRNNPFGLLHFVRSYVFIAVIAGAFSSMADQNFHLKASENTITAAISKTEITRFSFASEIESVHSLKGELEYEIAGKDLYLRVFVDKPINFFVKIFSGKTYKLITTPENIPATQVFVRAEHIKTAKPKCQNKERNK